MDSGADGECGVKSTDSVRKPLSYYNHTQYVNLYISICNAAHNVQASKNIKGSFQHTIKLIS